MVDQIHGCHTSTSALRPAFDALCKRYDMEIVEASTDAMGFVTRLDAASRGYRKGSSTPPDFEVTLLCQAPEDDDDVACDQLILLSKEVKFEIHRHRGVASTDKTLSDLLDLIDLAWE